MDQKNHKQPLDRLTKPATLNTSADASCRRKTRIIRLTPVITRLSVLASHSERVFSWTYEMRRLDWKLISATTIDALHDGWTYTITQQPDKWTLCVQPIPDRGPDWRKWFTTRYMQDAMAIAQSLAAGVDLS